MKKSFPKKALSFLRWFCHEDHIEEIEGNLLELYERQLAIAPKNANWMFWKNVLLHFRPEYIRSFLGFLNQSDQLKYNFKIAFRSFKNNKFYGLLNLSGLVVGITACFLLLLFIQRELGFDQFHQAGDRIYQVKLKVKFGGDVFNTSNTPPPVGETMQNAIPEIESYTRYFMPGSLVFRQQDQAYTENNVWAVDSNFLDFFTFPLLEGDAKTALTNINSIVLTKSMAKKYFGTTSVLGKEMLLNDLPYTVSGVLADLPQQSSLQFDMLLPIKASRSVSRYSWSWIWLQLDTYVKLKQPADDQALAAIHAKFPAMVYQYGAKAFKLIGRDLDEYFAEGNQWKLWLKPIKDVHLYSIMESTRIANLGSIKEVKVFGLVALLVLLLACVNFMNLSTARSMKRVKEVGVRKVLGSKRKDLIQQFMTEAIAYSLVAGLLTLIGMQFILPYFNELVGVQLTMGDFFRGWTLLAFIGGLILTGLLAGSYPALYLSGFKPIVALKNKITAHKNGHHPIRNGLVIFQFAISIALITATFIILQQIKYSKVDLGIDKNNVLVIPNIQHLGQQAKSFQEALEKLPEVLSTTQSSDVPTGSFYGDFYVPETDDQNNNLAQDLSLSSYMVDDNFIKTMGIEIIAGRNFDEQYGTDHQSVILNETAVKYVGWDNPIGKYITYDNSRRFQVIGVMKDFRSHSVRHPIYTIGLFHESSNAYNEPQSFISLRLQKGSEAKVIREAKALLAKFGNGLPFKYTFLNEDYNRLYQSETRTGDILSVFTSLSIFIACLGLLGLIAYTVEQRTKEIGIRKVLGASVTGIVGLLAKDYLKLIFFAFLLALPFSYFFINEWLNGFAYRIELKWWMFTLSGVVAGLIALATIGWQSTKAALNNPIDSLKME